MLYDDIQQLEVRFVISLEYHDVDIYAGNDDEIPEAELWIKRNAIRLRRKKIQPGDKAPSLPFFLFSENISEKEDFYFAMLTNMQKSLGDERPTPLEFDTAHIINLVQRLHSSEEQLQTRWLNAMLGRFFLAMYKTPELEAAIRQRLTKKIARVKKPDFITKLALQRIDTGTGAPLLTNPRLKDLTVNGDCTAEFDVEYNGGVRVELAATVRIDLGKRLGAREVDIVLAVTCKKLQGHMLARFKPPPSNRVWVTFEKAPKIEMKLEPIVSSRQITYNFILRQIESRILEVMAETIVLPFWDDIAFTHTEGEDFRGGIWKQDVKPSESTEIKDEVAEDEAEAGQVLKQHLIAKDERVMSMPVLPHSSDAAMKAAKMSYGSSAESIPKKSDGARTPDRASRAAAPRILRAPSFAKAADPMVSPSHAPGESPAIDIKAASKRDSMLNDLSARSLGTSPELAATSPPKENEAPLRGDRDRGDSTASSWSTSSAPVRRGTADTDTTLVSNGVPATTFDDIEAKSNRSSINDVGDDAKKPGLAAAARNFATPENHPKTIASIAAARDAAQKWSWGVLARNKQRAAENEHRPSNDSNTSLNTSQPMGRGHPLPPPGTPLPHPARANTGMFSSLQKRKPVPPPYQRDGSSTPTHDSGATSASGSPPKLQAPALPERRTQRRQSQLQMTEPQDEELLVVEAPQESAPTTPHPSAPATPHPTENEHHDDFFGHGEGEGAQKQNATAAQQPENAPPLPRRPSGRQGHDVYSISAT